MQMFLHSPAMSEGAAGLTPRIDLCPILTTQWLKGVPYSFEPQTTQARDSSKSARIKIVKGRPADCALVQEHCRLHMVHGERRGRLLRPLPDLYPQHGELPYLHQRFVSTPIIYRMQNEGWKNPFKNEIVSRRSHLRATIEFGMRPSRNLPGHLHPLRVSRVSI